MKTTQLQEPLNGALMLLSKMVLDVNIIRTTVLKPQEQVALRNTLIALSHQAAEVRSDDDILNLATAILSTIEGIPSLRQEFLGAIEQASGAGRFQQATAPDSEPLAYDQQQFILDSIQDQIDTLVHALLSEVDIGPPPATVTRYTDIACPRRVWLATPRVSVIVRLTAQSPAYSAAVQELKLDPTQAVRVSLQAPGFTILGQPVQSIAIPADADSAPVVFDLHPEKVGSATLTFDFLQGNQVLGTVTVAVEVTSYEVVEGAGPRPGRPLAFQPGVEHPDMVLHIAVEDSPPSLVFSLIRDGGAYWRTFPPVPTKLSPEAYTAEMYRSIASLVDSEDPVLKSLLGKRLSIPPDDVDRSVKKLGQNLWKHLIPDELKALYAAERTAWQDKTLLIFSDEPHLPWELVWPYDEDGQWKDDAPWCCTLYMTRWLRKDGRGNGNETPPGRLALRSLAVLAPTYSLLQNLQGAQLEKTAVLGLAAQHALRNTSPSLPTWGAVMDLLEGGKYDWMHAAAHGNFYAQVPDADSALWLTQDRALTPEHIVGAEIEAHLHKQRPGFFLNACQVGRQSWTLTRIGGWANRLISAGAGLFVGPLWEVRDDSALRFADTFYRALFDGKTVATATRKARFAAHAAGDPTWLAYSVYAHPNARIVWKTQANGE